MKKNTVWILMAVLLIVIIAGAAVAYNNYSKDYSKDSLYDFQSSFESSLGTSKNTAPDFMLYDKDGNEVRLSDFRGKPVVLNFWATWCYYCKEEMPDFEAMSKKYPDVQFMMINATDGVRETEESAKKYISDNGFTFDVFFDKNYDAVSAYGISGFPATFFIDKNGNLITGINGMTDSATLEKGISLITQ